MNRFKYMHSQGVYLIRFPYCLRYLESIKIIIDFQIVGLYLFFYSLCERIRILCNFGAWEFN